MREVKPNTKGCIWFSGWGGTQWSLKTVLKKVSSNLPKSKGSDAKSWDPLVYWATLHRTQMLIFFAYRPLWPQRELQLVRTLTWHCFRLKETEKKEHCVLSMWIFQCRCHPPIYNLLFVSSTQLFPSSACSTPIALHLKTLYSWIKSKQWVATAGQTQTVHHLELDPSQTKLAERLHPGAKWQPLQKIFSDELKCSFIDTSIISSNLFICIKFKWTGVYINLQYLPWLWDTAIINIYVVISLISIVWTSIARTWR